MKTTFFTLLLALTSSVSAMTFDVSTAIPCTGSDIQLMWSEVPGVNHYKISSPSGAYVITQQLLGMYSYEEGFWSIEAVNVNGTIADNKTIYITNCVASVDQISSTKLNIYPIPVINQLNIDTDENLQSISIYDFQGNKILECTKKQIDFSSLQSGVYFLQLQFNSGLLIKKIIKK